MSYKKQFFMDNLIHPWNTLQEFIDSIDMTQKDLAFRVGVTPKHINWIINAKDNITPDLALKLEKVLWVSASFWNNLQKSYDEDKVKIQEKELLKNEEKEVSKFTCYKELVKFWLVENTLIRAQRLDSILKFFSISSINMLDDLFNKIFWNNKSMAFRKYENTNFSKENFLSWLRVWEIIWNKIEVWIFSKDKLRWIIPTLKELTKNDFIDIKELEKIFAWVWVRFTFVKWFENNPIIWVTKKFRWNPFIQISDRWQKADIFWFTLFHEIWHIILHLSNDENIFIDYWEKDWTEIEVEADNFAQNNLINKEVYDYELTKKTVSVENIANISNIWKCIVAWRIAHDFSWKSNFWWNIWSLVNPYRIKLNILNSQI